MCRRRHNAAYAQPPYAYTQPPYGYAQPYAQPPYAQPPYVQPPYAYERRGLRRRERGPGLIGMLAGYIVEKHEEKKTQRVAEREQQPVQMQNGYTSREMRENRNEEWRAQDRELERSASWEDLREGEKGERLEKKEKDKASFKRDPPAYEEVVRGV